MCPDPRYSMIKKNNEKIGKAAAGASDSDTVSSKPKNDTKPELDDEDDEDEDAAEQPIDMEHDETADVATEDAETVDKDGIPAPPKIKKSVAAKPVKTVKKVAKPLAVAADGEHDADELQLDNDEDVDGLDQDIDNDDEDDEDDVDDCDDQPEYAVQKRTYIKLDCVHCCRSYYTIKVQFKPTHPHVKHNINSSTHASRVTTIICTAVSTRMPCSRVHSASGPR